MFDLKLREFKAETTFWGAVLLVIFFTLLNKFINN
jgi:hypothetical protein